jgi:AGCS family alanine or glycine:cation symporter
MEPSTSFLDQVNSSIKAVLDQVYGYIWEFPDAFPFMIILLLGTGIYITFRLGWPQIRYLKHSIDVTRGKYDDPKHEGDITHFQALSAALSATVGIGNIAGVATAIHYGGPGALFWMWVTGILGTSLKYTECTLSMKYRKINPDGSASGGPMYYIEKALGWKWLAIVFAVAAVCSSFGSGNAVQAFTVADQFNSDFGIPQWLTGLVAVTVVGAVIIGGIKRIGRVAMFLAPGMAILYFTGGILILLLHIDKIPGAFEAIFEGAFSKTGAVGGFAGSAFMHTLIWGVKRGLFSNEAGQGSAPIAHAAARTDQAVREGAVAMMGPYIDTMIICSITGLCIIVTGAWTAVVDGAPLNGSPMTTYAFEQGLPFLAGYGRYIVTFAVFLFAVSTMITWSYYGDRSAQYLFGTRAVMPYKYIFCVFLYLGAILKLEVVWGWGDIMLAFMAIPNLIAIILLAGRTKIFTREYFSQKHVPLR